VLDVNFFDQLQIGLATADDIRTWSHGEVKKPAAPFAPEPYV
jgi:DNA-directed RNA polymerase subunit beta'